MLAPNSVSCACFETTESKAGDGGFECLALPISYGDGSALHSSSMAAFGMDVLAIREPRLHELRIGWRSLPATPNETARCREHCVDAVGRFCEFGNAPSLSHVRRRRLPESRECSDSVPADLCLAKGPKLHCMSLSQNEELRIRRL